MAPADTIQEAPGKSRRTLLGKKLGMTQLYLESGQWVPVTVLQAGPCTILQVKTPERDGYAAVQLGFDATKKPRKRPQQAYLERLGILGQRFVREVPGVDPQHVQAPSATPSSSSPPTSSPETPPSEASPVEPQATAAASGEAAAPEAAAPEAPAPEAGAPKSSGPDPETLAMDQGPVRPGAIVGVSVFKDVTYVDVRGRTKGRGFQGVIKRHHFNAGPKSHGTKNIREPGSTGMHTDPARVLPGKKMPGHLGAVYRKARNLKVIRVDEEQNLLVVRGAVPGPNGGYVTIEESRKA